VAIKTVKTLDIKMPYPIEMKRLMGKWRCRVIVADVPDDLPGIPDTVPTLIEFTTASDDEFIGTHRGTRRTDRAR
jgi:hypothetical protein